MKKRRISRVVKKICFSSLLAVICIGAGCAQRHIEKEDLLAVEPNVAALVIPGDYAFSAIGAAGGLEAWTKTVKFDLDCVVTFYQQDNSFYLTENHFEIYPWSNSIRISAQEPQGKFIWQLSAGQFNLLEGNRAADSAKFISDRDYAEAMLVILTAPVRFLDKPALSAVEGSVSFVKKPTPVKKEGLWYYPIEMTGSSMLPSTLLRTGDENRVSSIEKRVPPYWSKVVFFQNTGRSLVDMIWLVNSEQDKFFAVRSYDYKKVDKNGILVPTKIEIFRSDARAVLKERLVKVDFKHRNSG
jgi:hypothetical protein